MSPFFFFFFFFFFVCVGLGLQTVPQMPKNKANYGPKEIKDRLEF
jgi:hypothetical protein